MAATVRPSVVWQGPQSWLDVEHTSSLGTAHTYVGPLPAALLTPMLVEAVGQRVRVAIEQAAEHVGQALAADSTLCSRCARTLMRSALGSPDDAAAVLTGGKPGDEERYARIWGALGGRVQAVQAALTQLRAEAASGAVIRELSAGADDPAAEEPLARVAGSPWAHLYEQGGWPLKAGQWQDYKLCACGDPNDAQSTPTMLVSGTSLAKEPEEAHHHTGGAACGCTTPRSP